MQAAVFKQVGHPLVIEYRPDPTPATGEVVIKVERCGICSSDLHMTERHAISAPSDSVLGHEFAGEIVALGREVDTLRIGDHVTALPLTGCGHCVNCLGGNARWCTRFEWRPGGYAEYVLADARGCTRLPLGLSSADGALVEPLAVALNATQLATMPLGCKVLVMGAGPIGLATAWWATRLGATQVVVTATSNRRRNIALQMGVTNFFVSDANFPNSAVEQLGGAPDLVFECVGQPGMIQRAVEAVKLNGTVVVAGYCMELDEWLPVVGAVKQARIQFASLYSNGQFCQALEALSAGHVEPRSLITDTVRLPELPSVFESLRQRGDHCKVQLAPWM